MNRRIIPVVSVANPATAGRKPTLLWLAMLALLWAIVVFGAAAALGGEIADLHRKWVRPKPLDTRPLMERFERLNTPRHGVTEIGLERSPCLGTCPVYFVVLRADGTLRYTGEQHVPHKGVRTGTISDWEFNQLAEFLVESRYMEMESNYEVPLTDMPATFTTAVVDGKRKVIRNYGDVGPLRLWALQQAIDGIVSRAAWDDAPQPDADGTPRP